MRWSPQQDQALLAVDAWLRDASSPQVFYLAGYAGTGKTTLARHFTEDVGLVYYAAYTGKAASVLRQKGCPNASTIHKLIYIPRSKCRSVVDQLREELDQLKSLPEERRGMLHADEVRMLETKLREQEQELRKPMFTRNVGSNLRYADLVVVDECSMVSQRVADDLASYGVKMLVLGDPAQLPPVGERGAWTDLEPDFVLTEIHRQARDNPIIEMATRVRMGDPLRHGQYGSSVVKTRATVADAQQADQILCGTNTTRTKKNARMRRLHSRSSWEPETGDKVVCLRNDHEIGLLNGSVWRVVEPYPCDGDIDQVAMSIVPTDGDAEPIDVISWAHRFRGDDPKTMPWWDLKEAQEFDYGYVLTAHKAQGSQWDDVLVYDESHVFRGDARKWLYTAITRAAERVTVIR